MGEGSKLALYQRAGVREYKSSPALWLDTKALLNRDIAALIAGLQAGIAATAH